MNEMNTISRLAILILIVSSPSLEALPEGDFELGDAVYNELVVSGFNTYYDHAGIFIGVRPSSYYGEPYGIVLEALSETGVTENTLYTFGVEFGPYYPIGATFSDRLAAVQTALECKGLPYVSNDNDPDTYNALNFIGSTWEGDVSDIKSIRCDGLVEYCMEYNRVGIWKKSDLWDISRPTDSDTGENLSLDVHNDLPPLIDLQNPCYFYPKTQRGGALCGSGESSTTMYGRGLVDLPEIESVETLVSQGYELFKVNAFDESSGIAYLRFAIMDVGDSPGFSDWDYADLADPGDYEQTRDLYIWAYRPGDYYFQAVDGGGNLSDIWPVYGFVPSQENPAASIQGFSVAGDWARWKVDSEFETASYQGECSGSPTGPWVSAGDRVPAGAGHRKCALYRRAAWYRLLEIEVDGSERVHAIAAPGSFSQIEPASDSRSEEIKAKVLERQHRREKDLAGTPPRWGEGEGAVIYCPATLRTAVDFGLVGYWAWCGYDVRVVEIESLPSSPNEFRAALRDSIAAEAAGGRRYFLLVGDANDWQYFDLNEQGSSLWVDGWAEVHQSYLDSGYPPSGQVERDQIPTFMLADTDPRDQNLAWFTPYILSDFPYSDIDDDGLPDVVLTRLPFDSEWEIWNFSERMQLSQEGERFGAKTVSFFIGDYEYGNGTNTGQLARLAVDTLTTLLPSEVQTWTLFESEIFDPGERNLAAASHWNSVRPDLLLMLASRSNRSWPANFFDQTSWNNPWSMDMIYPYGSHAPLVFSGSCGGADFARTEDPDYDLPISHRFLKSSTSGAMAWVGPSLGSWQAGNIELAQAFVEELYTVPERPAAEAFMLAQRRTLQEFFDRPEITSTVQSYVFLGDPLSRLTQTQVSVSAPDSEGESFAMSLERNYPNPFNPVTHIVLDLHRTCEIDLAVYDLGGRKQRSLEKGLREAGRHVIVWRGDNEKGEQLASGIYFARLRGEGQEASLKMLLLK